MGAKENRNRECRNSNDLPHFSFHLAQSNTSADAQGALDHEEPAYLVCSAGGPADKTMDAWPVKDGPTAPVRNEPCADSFRFSPLPEAGFGKGYSKDAISIGLTLHPRLEQTSDRREGFRAHSEPHRLREARVLFAREPLEDTRALRDESLKVDSRNRCFAYSGVEA